ncbi:FHA domain-containing protein [Planctomicrobium sp. SH661]|uniref:FHA domain-containing protein n=1 Tax=Planctomicrobium sp. SH661 TaxID=3448124 RepID=UPI003F5BF887
MQLLILFEMLMDDPVKAMLGYAAAVPGPLRLRVRTAEGAVEEQEINSPFAIIGRGPGNDIRLPEPTVSFRHLYLQAIGSRVACIDLLSVGGVRQNGAPFRGWLTSQHVLQIGSSELQLLGQKWVDDDATLKPPLEFRPRDEQRPEYGPLPTVELELLNTQHQGMKWPINRVITLVGRDDRCRITVADERLSRVQCALLLLPSGLWVIDLLGKGGILLNGEPCPCGLLSAGAELTIGPYKLTGHYPDIAAQLMTASTYAQANGGEFLTRPNRIYQTEFYHDTLIVVPQGDSQAFFYQDIHVEANRVVDLITQRGFNHLVIDFSRVDQIGHLAVEGLLNICRSAPGRITLCCANSHTYEHLQTSPISRLYHHYNSRQDALQAIYSQV